MTRSLKLTFSLPMIFLFNCLFGQTPELKITLEKIIEHAENNSLYRNDVNWDDLKKDMYNLATDAVVVEDLKPALDLMLKELNDSHGRIFYNRRYLSYYSGESMPHRANMDSEIYNKIQSGQVYNFLARMLDDHIGYVRIVGLPMGDNTKMSAEIQDAVCDLLEKGAKKWIIDLRYNGGGNMFPMIEGITSIVGDGLVGGTKGATEEESSVWQIKDGDFYYDEQSVALTNRCAPDKLPKIAVLTSVYTASSGEALAVILKNRENTRFFGNKTMGMITATDWKQIDSLTFMSISVSYYKDRANKLYDQFVDVDEEIPFEADVNFDKDPGILRAINWLSK